METVDSIGSIILAILEVRGAEKAGDQKRAQSKWLPYIEELQLQSQDQCEPISGFGSSNPWYRRTNVHDTNLS